MIRCLRHLPRSARRETARREQRPPGPKSLKIKEFHARRHEGQVRVRQFPRKDLQPSFALLEGAMFLNCSRLQGNREHACGKRGTCLAGVKSVRSTRDRTWIERFGDASRY